MLSSCGVGKDSWESLGLQVDQPVNPKGNQSWIFTGRTDAEAETQILWPPNAKSQLTGKDPEAEKDWGQEEKGMTEDGMVGWHHWLNGHGFEQALGVGDGQGSLVCCHPWCCKKSDMNEWLNWTECPENTAGSYTLVALIMEFAFWYPWILVLQIALTMINFMQVT